MKASENKIWMCLKKKSNEPGQHDMNCSQTYSLKSTLWGTYTFHWTYILKVVQIYLNFKQFQNENYEKNDFSIKAWKQCLISQKMRGSHGNFHKM